jgi:hypothetical protein
MGVYDGCNGIGRIVEAVHKFESERDEQRNAEKDKCADRDALLAGVAHVAEYIERSVAETHAQHRQERDSAADMRFAIQMRTWRHNIGCAPAHYHVRHLVSSGRILKEL